MASDLGVYVRSAESQYAQPSTRRTFLKAVGKSIAGISAIGTLEKMLGGVANAYQDELGGYDVPNLIGPPQTVLVHDSASKKIPNDVIIKLDWYKLENNRKVARVSINGLTYGYTFREPDGNHYGIVDVDGDGVFRRKYFKGEFYDVPDWVVSKMNITKK